MSLWKRGNVWWGKVVIDGKRHQFSTRMTNKNEARDKEREIILALRSGQPAKKEPILLGDFLKLSFLPHIEVNFRQKPKTRDYYVFGSRRLERSNISKLELGQIDSEEVGKFIHSVGQELSPSTVNQALRTLRRSLNLAVEWKRIPVAPKFSLLTERKREQILDEEQEAAYLAAAEEPWRTIATLWVKLGMRPGEIVRLRAEDLDWSALQLHVRAGKSKAAVRPLPMTGPVYQALSAHCLDIEEGYIFPAPRDPSKHISEKRIVDWHERTLKKLWEDRSSEPAAQNEYLEAAREPWRTILILRNETGLRVADIVRFRHRDLHLSKRQIYVSRDGNMFHKIKVSDLAAKILRAYLTSRKKVGEWVFPSSNPMKHVDRKRVRDWDAQTLKRLPGSFVPYIMRHTALTRLANKEGVSLPTVAAAAGHSSIAVTQRYVHPQKNDIRKAFELMTGEKIGDARRREILKLQPKPAASLKTDNSLATKLATVPGEAESNDVEDKL